MFKNLTYKNRVIALLILFAAGCLLAYSFAISETIHLRRECIEAEQQIGMAQDAPLQLAAIESRLDDIDLLLGNKDSATSNVQSELLDRLGGFCKDHNMVLREFPDAHHFQQQDYLVQTYRVVLEGSFVNMLGAIYGLEKEFRSTKVRSVNFRAETDYRTNRVFLTATIFIQSIVKTENNI